MDKWERRRRAQIAAAEALEERQIAHEQKIREESEMKHLLARQYSPEVQLKWWRKIWPTPD